MMKITDGMVRVLRSLQAGETLTRTTQCEMVYRLTGRVLPLKRETVDALVVTGLINWIRGVGRADVADITDRGLAAIAAYGLQTQSLAMLRRLHKFDRWNPGGRAALGSRESLRNRGLIDGHDRITDMGARVLRLLEQ